MTVQDDTFRALSCSWTTALGLATRMAVWSPRSIQAALHRAAIAGIIERRYVDGPGRNPMAEYRVSFACHVCGASCDIAPTPPARAVCPKHCEDHDYEYDRDMRERLCTHCGEPMPYDLRGD